MSHAAAKILKAGSRGEEAFALHYRAKLHPINWPEREYRFHPQRKWRFDFAFLGPKIAVEIEGGIWVQGRHQQARGFETDAAKYNQAVLMGWRVLRYSTAMVERGDAIRDVEALLK